MSAPQKIIAGLYQLSGAVNIFILETGEDELTIVDTGMPGSTKKVLQAVQSLGYQASDVKHILITHADLDHVGSLAGLASQTQAVIYASEKSTPYIEKVQSPPHLPPVFSTLGGLAQKIFQKAVHVNHRVYDGETLAIGGGIQVLAAPGHTPDNYNYYWVKKAVLFAPDLLDRRSGQLALTSPAITWNIDEAKASARKMLDLDPKIICVGHGDAVIVEQAAGEVDALKSQL